MRTVGSTNNWWVVGVACAAQFMVVLDTTIVNVALPAMRADLRLSAAGQQWVVTAYLVTFGGALLLAARLGDLYGRRRIFLAGLVAFTLASLVGGLATDGGVLIGARLVQGLGAAALAPTSLSLITASQPDGHRRARALSFWSAAASSAGAAGMVLGGVLTAQAGWRWVFFVNVPIGVALFAAAVALLASDVDTARTRLDVPGAATLTLGVAALVYAISTGDGWSSPAAVGGLVVAAVMLAAFVAVERRVARPLVPGRILRHGNVRAANAVTFLLGAAMTATIFFTAVSLQQVAGYGALRTGLALLPFTAALLAGTFTSRRLLPVAGPRRLVVAGALVTTAGLAWLSALSDTPSYMVDVLGPTVVAGAGMSLMVLPVTVAATAGVAPGDAGLASGLLNTGRQLGGAVGLAVLVTIATQGYAAALLTAAGVALAAAAAGLLLRAHDPAPAPTPAPQRA